MHVSLTAEKIFDLGPLPVTNSLMTTWLVLLLVTLFAVVFRLRLKKNPQGIQNVVEAVMEAFRSLVESVTNNEQQTRKFFPIIFTIFLFVLLNNWAGLIPGVGSVGIFHTPTEAHAATTSESIPTAHTTESPADTKELSLTNTTAHIQANSQTATEESSDSETATVSAHADAAKAEASGETHESPFTPIFRPGTADLSFTLALAFCAVLLTQIMGVMSLGGWGYFSRFLNFHNPIHFFVGLLEIISEFSKMISFSFRLFGNIFAGEVLLTVIIALAPYIVPMPFYGLEIFVGAVQALVFSVLTLVFFKGAVTEAH